MKNERKGSKAGQTLTHLTELEDTESTFGTGSLCVKIDRIHLSILLLEEVASQFGSGTDVPGFLLAQGG